MDAGIPLKVSSLLCLLKETALSKWLVSHLDPQKRPTQEGHPQKGYQTPIYFHRPLGCIGLGGIQELPILSAEAPDFGVLERGYEADKRAYGPRASHVSL